MLLQYETGGILVMIFDTGMSDGNEVEKWHGNGNVMMDGLDHE
jgi:hypothetical protein